MSALAPIATTKADFGKPPCLLAPESGHVRCMAHVCFRPKADMIGFNGPERFADRRTTDQPSRVVRQHAVIELAPVVKSGRHADNFNWLGRALSLAGG